MPTDKEKHLALYQKEYETFEDQLEDWYRARRASDMQKLLAGNYMGTDAIKRLMSGSMAEETQAKLQGLSNLEQLKTLEEERAEAERLAHEEQVQGMWGNIIGGAVSLGTAFIPGVGLAISAPAGALTKGLLSVAGFGKDVAPYLTTQAEKEAEINKRVNWLENYLNELKSTTPELQIPEELQLSRFEGKKEPWTYWQV